MSKENKKLSGMSASENEADTPIDLVAESGNILDDEISEDVIEESISTTEVETDSEPDSINNKRVWLIEPKDAATLKTKHGILKKGFPTAVVEGSEIYNFYRGRADVRLWMTKG